MNKILLGVNAVLVAAVAFLFFKVNSLNNSSVDVTTETEKVEEKPKLPEAAKKIEQVGNAPTGKIAFVNIDKLNDESLEISDLVAETKRRKSVIEASMESLNDQYTKEVEEFQRSQKAGIATQADMEMKARKIQQLEMDAQNKQLQMDNLSQDMNEKNNNFQKNVRELLLKYNAGKYDYILSYSEAIPSMLLGNTALEITGDVIKELNADYKLAKTKKTSKK
ncbi:OmpH family outer membrane protein [Aurantibacillus circumpalustris]|uniref:OmpH family outer membrane protein n=1 Tax=Aurantibacillus circumpalustris TaxID=3036359 RepID=UPI00295A737C|nr:OmpH family outer membrane protein [Aurantibacillus circumpalustris]